MLQKTASHLDSRFVDLPPTPWRATSVCMWAHTCLIPQTGSEYHAWLLYYSLPVLSDILPQPCLAHWALLVAAMHILFADVIPLWSVQSAETYLLQFYPQTPVLYGGINFLSVTVMWDVHGYTTYPHGYIGENAATLNVHLLRHIPDCVRDWGTLWAYSCFVFESLNGHLKKFFHGTRSMNTQVCIHIYVYVHNLRSYL